MSRSKGRQYASSCRDTNKIGEVERNFNMFTKQVDVVVQLDKTEVTCCMFCVKTMNLNFMGLAIGQREWMADMERYRCRRTKQIYLLCSKVGREYFTNSIIAEQWKLWEHKARIILNNTQLWWILSHLLRFCVYSDTRRRAGEERVNWNDISQCI